MEGTHCTYKEAKESSTPTMILALSAICMFFSKNAGRTAQAKSVKMVDAVEVYDRPIIASMVAHLALPVATRLLSQLPATGRHSSKTPMKVVAHDSQVVARSAMTAKRNHLIVLAMRSMVTQMELFTTARQQMYVNIQIRSHMRESCAIFVLKMSSSEPRPARAPSQAKPTSAM